MKKQVRNQSWPVFSEEEVQIVSDILRSGKVNYWTGDQGKLFEQEFAEYIGVNHAIALANGTLALELALKALGIAPCDEVIVPSRTYIATASAVVIAGAKPVIADVDRVSGNMSVETIHHVRTDKTKAIIVVHLAGWPCDMDPIMKYAKQHDLLVIEDCAQAHGASYEGRKVGSFGNAAAFSFCQDKIMTTCGEGGMVVFQDKDTWSQAWSFKDHGKSYDAVYSDAHAPGFRWLVDSFGSNYRMTEIQAGVGRFQLKKLDEWLGIRQRNAAILDSCFNELPLLRQVKLPDNIMHARYKYYTYINLLNLKKGYSRGRIMEDFDAYGIPCFSGSCSEIYLERAFKNASFGPNNRLTSAKELGETSLMFLVDPTLSIADMGYICDVSRKVFMNATS
jgi:dTDP-4-amino-4,6-dideoxygalactose transaminase